MTIPSTIAAIQGTCDTHVHVFKPGRFPYAEGRAYTPGEANIGDLEAFMTFLGVSRCVVVQPSVYGSDNSCLLAALQHFGPARARGVAVIDHTNISNAELIQLRDAGVRAVRVNFEAAKASASVNRLSIIRATARRAKEASLAVQLYVDMHTAIDAARELGQEGVPLILDHFAGLKCGIDLEKQSFTRLLRALETGNVWVKLSAPYRTGSRAADYDDVRAAAKAMIAVAPDRMIWASDWPHTGGGQRDGKNPNSIEPFRTIDDRSDLSRFQRWIADDGIYTKILANNAEQIFDFPSA
jgi:2-pyrone-4,6-dicarboxylate lactonase